MHNSWYFLFFFHMTSDVKATGNMQNRFRGYQRTNRLMAQMMRGVWRGVYVGTFQKRKHLFATFHDNAVVHQGEFGNLPGICHFGGKKIVGLSKWYLFTVFTEPFLNGLKCSVALFLFSFIYLKPSSVVVGSSLSGVKTPFYVHNGIIIFFWCYCQWKHNSFIIFYQTCPSSH